MLDIFRKEEKLPHVNPRVRAYGKARIDIAQRAATRDDWDRLWKKSTYPFPFSWGGSWKHCIEYKVGDFPAEVGFFIDILGFPVNAFDPDYAMFTSPDGDFFFSVVPVREKDEITAPDSIRLQFMVERILDTAIELERRGVKFDQWPSVSAPGSPLIIGSFRTPNGINIDLWGFVSQEDGIDSEQQEFVGEEGGGELDLATQDELADAQEEELDPVVEEESNTEIDQMQLPPPRYDTYSDVEIDEDNSENDDIEDDQGEEFQYVVDEEI